MYGASGGNRTLVAALARQSITTMLHSLVKKVRTLSVGASYSREESPLCQTRPNHFFEASGRDKNSNFL